MFTSDDPNDLAYEAGQDEEYCGENFFVSENQIYKVLTYFGSTKLYVHGNHYDLTFIHGDPADRHEQAVKLAKEIKHYKDHKLRPMMRDLVDLLPAHNLF